MSKPEANFVNKVHRQLPKSVYRQGMGLTATNGTPDVYYEGTGGILWVEYKWVATMPDMLDLTSKPKLSKLQSRWLTRAFDNNQNVAVIVGSPDTCLILTELFDWEVPIDTLPHADDFDGVVEFIKETCLL